MTTDYELALKLQHQLQDEHHNVHNEEEKTNLLIAIQIQQQYDEEYKVDNAGNQLYYVDKKNVNKDNQKSLIDPSWEIIDPTPDIHILFMTYNKQFFWNKLLSVCVDWSKRMTTCAGVCSYSGGGMCKITLSEPLLKLRPRKDLVETLLHEMIHAYLFVTHNNKDRTGHGPEFHKHMYRINSEAGTRITVYHDFHDEVRLYKQHWWKCNGPCQHRKPYFGTVKRATNRAPGPNDFWWAEHMRCCGGEFIKVKEPEKTTKSKTGGTNVRKGTTTTHKASDITLKPETDSQIGLKSTQNVASSKTDIRNYFIKDDDKENKSTYKINLTPLTNLKKPQLLVGSSSTSTFDYSVVRNHWLKKFENSIDDKVIEMESNPKRMRLDIETVPEVTCPICNQKCLERAINEHLDKCVSTKESEDYSNSTKCDICNKLIMKQDLVTHMQDCLDKSSDMDESFILINDED